MTLTLKERKNDTILASGEEDQTVREFEGNWYFAPETVRLDHLKVTDRTYRCPYKGICYWIDLDAPDAKAKNIGWVYRDPIAGYEFIKDQIGFYARTSAEVEAIRS
jgi:uncharacterized protein (DUF427 family)